MRLKYIIYGCSHSDVYPGLLWSALYCTLAIKSLQITHKYLINPGRSVSIVLSSHSPVLYHFYLLLLHLMLCPAPTCAKKRRGLHVQGGDPKTAQWGPWGSDSILQEWWSKCDTSDVAVLPLLVFLTIGYVGYSPTTPGEQHFAHH